MAQGDVVVFAKHKQDIGLKLHELETDAFNLGLVTNVVTPTETTSDPRWGAGGGTNLSSNQVTPGGNYSTGGPLIANNTWTLSSGTVTFDGDNISILQNAGNPTNARWGIGYNNTDAGKRAGFFLDLGSVTDLTLGDLSVTWNASGLWTLA
jgi:hypothetical protein